MTEVEKLNNQLTQIRAKLKKNTKALSQKKSSSQTKTLTREKSKLEKQEQKLLTKIQEAVKKQEREQKKEVKTLKQESAGKDRKIDSLERQVPIMAVEDDDFEID